MVVTWEHYATRLVPLESMHIQNKTHYIPESIDADSSSCDLGKRAKRAARARMTVSCDLGKASETSG